MPFVQGQPYTDEMAMGDLFAPAWAPGSYDAATLWNKLHLKTPPKSDPPYVPSPLNPLTVRDAITQQLMKQQSDGPGGVPSGMADEPGYGILDIPGPPPTETATPPATPTETPSATPTAAPPATPTTVSAPTPSSHDKGTAIDKGQETTPPVTLVDPDVFNEIDQTTPFDIANPAQQSQPALAKGNQDQTVAPGKSNIDPGLTTATPAPAPTPAAPAAPVAPVGPGGKDQSQAPGVPAPLDPISSPLSPHEAQSIAASQPSQQEQVIGLPLGVPPTEQQPLSVLDNMTSIANAPGASKGPGWGGVPAPGQSTAQATQAPTFGWATPPDINAIVSNAKGVIGSLFAPPDIVEAPATPATVAPGTIGINGPNIGDPSFGNVSNAVAPSNAVGYGFGFGPDAPVGFGGLVGNTEAPSYGGWAETTAPLGDPVGGWGGFGIGPGTEGQTGGVAEALGGGGTPGGEQGSPGGQSGSSTAAEATAAAAAEATSAAEAAESAAAAEATGGAAW